MNNEANIKKVVELDKMLRQIIPEYFVALQNMNEPDKAVKLLTEHLSIMVEMINTLKK